MSNIAFLPVTPKSAPPHAEAPAVVDPPTIPETAGAVIQLGRIQTVGQASAKVLDKVRAGLLDRAEQDLAREREKAAEYATQVSFFRVHKQDHPLYDSYQRKLADSRGRIAQLEEQIQTLREGA